MENEVLLPFLLLAALSVATIWRLIRRQIRREFRQRPRSRSRRPRPERSYRRQVPTAADKRPTEKRDPQPLPDVCTAKVQRVLDGDTVVVTMGYRRETLRLDAIDCPEGDQEWGDIAKYGLIKLIGGRNIQVELHTRDQYGRLVATIYVRSKGNGEWQNVNARMVTLGHAWVYRQYYGHLSPARRNELNQLERWARRKRMGLWQTDNPVPPWRWRSGAS